jgi:hypothetical protein
MQHVPDIAENVDRCACPGCLSNPTPADVLYCGRDLIVDEVQRRGCLCLSCPLSKSYRLSDEYYCETPTE